MNGKKKWLAVILGICFVGAAHAAVAETNIDVRVKLGSAAGVDSVEFSDIIGPSADASQKNSGNFQVEAAFSPRHSSPVSFVGTVGFFGRDHKGHIGDLFYPPTDVEYSASGLCGSAGVSIKANEKVHFEGRFELAVGEGKPKLTSPVAIWHPVKEGVYSAGALILGGYFTISNPGLQLGLELGVQTFEGDFQIWNSGGFWSDGNVTGTGGTANLVVGYRF
jgi:hypothetical protein